MRVAGQLDVDWLQGKSIQFFPVRFAAPTDIALEIRQVLGGPDGELAGQLQIIELSRLNGLLVVARSPAGLDRAAEWIGRFDRAPPPASRRLRSIALSNLEAEPLVETLSRLLEGGSGTSGSSAPPMPTSNASGGAPVGSSSSTSASAVAVASQTPQASGRPILSTGGLRLTADPRTNSLILLADDAEYRNVLDIVRQLDAPPLQVLIEATVAEVTLNDRVRFGVQWFLEDGDLAGVLQRHALTRQELDGAGLAEWFSRLGATPTQEDCLRRDLTLGRAPEEIIDVTSEEARTIREISVGDQVDIRAAIAGIAGAEVLWVRARRLSLPGQPWAIHDWRRLSIASSASCPVGDAADSVADDLTGR